MSKPLANPEFSRAMAALRQSSACDRHADARTKRARTRGAARARAIREEH